MDQGTREDYDLVAIHDSKNERNLSKRVIQWLQMMDGDSPYQISRLQHSLQTATRAEEDGADVSLDEIKEDEVQADEQADQETSNS